MFHVTFFRSTPPTAEREVTQGHEDSGKQCNLVFVFFVLPVDRVSSWISVAHKQLRHVFPPTIKKWGKLEDAFIHNIQLTSLQRVQCSNKYYFRLIRFSGRLNKCFEYNENILGEYAYKSMFLPIIGRVRKPGLKTVQLCACFQGELKFVWPLKDCWLESIVDLGHQQVYCGGELGNLLFELFQKQQAMQLSR